MHACKQVIHAYLLLILLMNLQGHLYVVGLTVAYLKELLIANYSFWLNFVQSK